MPRATNLEVIQGWARAAGTDAKLPEGRGSVSSDRNAIYSYWHFTLGEIQAGEQGNPRGFFLLNGDRWSGGSRSPEGSTTWQQSRLRDACQALPEDQQIPIMIVPFSVLASAGIFHHTIRPVEITKDTYEPVVHEAGSYNAIPRWIRDSYEWTQANGAQMMAARDMRELDGGRWTWTTDEHLLGASLFTAEYDEYHPPTATSERRTVRKTAYFLSAFDVHDGNLYFLCELPQGVHPSTVAEALEMLKPQAVLDAERNNVTVFRQGDVFAVQTGLTTPANDAAALVGTRKVTPERMAYVLGTNHVATESVVVNGETYARGILHHKPAHRPADHARVYLGDRRTWFRLVKNTVPADPRGESRAWAPAGGNGRARVD